MAPFGWFKRKAREAETPSLEELTRRLRDADADAATREDSARAIGALGEEGWESIGALTEALRDNAKPVRLEAADALIKVGGDLDTALAAMTALLADGDAATRRAAAAQIGRSGARAAPAADPLLAALDDPDDAVVGAAVDALLQIGQPVVAALVEAIKTGAGRPRDGAARAAAKIAPVAIPAFIDMTDSDDEAIRFIGALGLADLVPADETLEIVLEALGHADPFYRAWAARVIGLFGPEVEGQAGVPLDKAAADAEPAVREAAASARAKIRPENES